MTHTIEDVFDAIRTKLNSPIARVGRDVAVTALTVNDPLLGVSLEGLNKILYSLDEYRINCLIYGLATDLNFEKHINELYSYVISDSERAFIVGKLMRQTLEAESPKISVLYGWIIANHTGEKRRNFEHDELIVCNALKNANDYDLNMFVILMNECVISSDGIERIIFNKDNQNIKNIEDELALTCSWCAFNRLFDYNPMEWINFSESTLDIDPHYKVLRTAYILKDWIDEVDQIWNYG